MNIFNNEYFREINFVNIELKESIIKDKEFYLCNFEKSNFYKTNFINCRFEECKFINCDLSLIKINQSEFINISFEECKMLGINWTEAKNITRLNFLKSKLNHSSFYGMKLKDLIIEDCISQEVDFVNAVIQKAILCNTDLTDSKFNNTDLSGVDLSNAKNYNINPNYNKIMKAKFTIPDVLNLLQGFDIIIK